MFRGRSLSTSLLSICAVFFAVVHYNGLRHGTPLTRSAILCPGQSPRSPIYKNVDEGSFFELTGFNRRSFAILVNLLFPNPVWRQFDRPRLKRHARFMNIIFK